MKFLNLLLKVESNAGSDNKSLCIHCAEIVAGKNTSNTTKILFLIYLIYHNKNTDYIDEAATSTSIIFTKRGNKCRIANKNVNTTYLSKE